SQWDKASDFLDLLATNPAFTPIVMDLVITMKQLGPLGKKLSERFEKLLPPQVREPKEGEPQIPPEAQQQLAQMQQMIQALTEELNAKPAQTRTDQVKAQAAAELKKFEIASKERIEMAKLEVKIAEIATETDLEMFKQRVQSFLSELRAARQPG